MKILSFVFLFFSLPIFANELTLEKSNDYEVPQGKSWILKSIEPADYKVCTSDLRIAGGLAIGNKSELTIHGDFEISFNSKSHSSIKLFTGTKFWLGDSRPTIKVIELVE